MHRVGHCVQHSVKGVRNDEGGGWGLGEKGRDRDIQTGSYSTVTVMQSTA